MTKKFLIAAGKRQAARLAVLLKAEGYGDILAAHDCDGAVEAARSFLPDVVIVDAECVGGDPLAAVGKMLSERPVPVIMQSSYAKIDLVLHADEMGVSAHFFRPVARENLLGAISLGISRFRQCQLLRSEVGDCKEALRVRKLVERAKGILMKRGPLSEEQAFLKLQKLARDKNLKMEAVAQSIITANELI